MMYNRHKMKVDQDTEVVFICTKYKYLPMMTDAGVYQTHSGKKCSWGSMENVEDSNQTAIKQNSN